MKILIICRAFAPDSVIGAIRITQFAKYLSIYGNDVDVICSGGSFWKSDTNLLEGLSGVNVFHYDVASANNTSQRSNKKSSAFKKIRNNKFLSLVLHLFYDPYKYFVKDGLKIKKKICALYKSRLSKNKYDLVLSTYSPIGTLMAAKRIRKDQLCKWIIDFRDPMVRPIQTFFNKQINRIYEKKYISSCDACLCVSQAFKKRLDNLYPKRKKAIHLIYNGFAEEKSHPNQQTVNNEFIICYTGTIYELQDFSMLFEIIAKNREILFQEQLRVKLYYAGTDGDKMISLASKYTLSEMVKDFGLISRKESLKLQKQSDLFLLAAWNTKLEKGVLTGKFFEGLASGKPIIALVSGPIPNSELGFLIKELGVGVCYEEAEERTKKPFESFILEAFKNKLNGTQMSLKKNLAKIESFSYGEIVKKLNELIKTV